MSKDVTYKLRKIVVSELLKLETIYICIYLCKFVLTFLYYFFKYMNLSNRFVTFNIENVFTYFIKYFRVGYFAHQPRLFHWYQDRYVGLGKQGADMERGLPVYHLVPHNVFVELLFPLQVVVSRDIKCGFNFFQKDPRKSYGVLIAWCTGET